MRQLLLLPLILILNSCINHQMREITARNNGTKFWMYTANDRNNHWEYYGGTDRQNRAHGFGRYEAKDDFYGGNHLAGSGKFIHGQPDGDHQITNQFIDAVTHYSNGRRLAMTKTRNDMPAHIAGSVVGGAQAWQTAQNNTKATQIIGKDDGGPWYPIKWSSGLSRSTQGVPTTVGGVPVNDKTQAILIKPGSGTSMGRIVPK